MSFEEPNDPRSSEIGNNQIQLTDLATYEERTPACHAPGLFCCGFAPHVFPVTQFLPSLIVDLFPGVSRLPP